MSAKSFYNSKPLATVTIKHKVVSYEYRNFLLFELAKPTLSGFTHAVISESGRCVAVGIVSEGRFEVGFNDDNWRY